LLIYIHTALLWEIARKLFKEIVQGICRSCMTLFSRAIQSEEAALPFTPLFTGEGDEIPGASWRVDTVLRLRCDTFIGERCG